MVQLRFISVAVLAGFLIQLAICQKNTCPMAYAPDGTQYDLSAIASKVQYYYANQNGQQYVYNISVCSPLPTGCAGSCASPYSSGVCQTWGSNAKCLGQYAQISVVGLNGGSGVQITYSGGDVCGSCNPPGPRQSVITLTCSTSSADPTKVEWTSLSGGEPGMPPVTYFNGTIYCPNIASPVAVPVRAPQSGSNRHVTVQYFGSGTKCSSSSVYMATVNYTTSCTPGCQTIGSWTGGSFVMTTCDENLNLPNGETWIEQIHYNEYDCKTPQYSIYKKSKYCNSNFSSQKCDADTVYNYSCDSASCNYCTLSSKVLTNLCILGQLYQCIQPFDVMLHPQYAIYTKQNYCTDDLNFSYQTCDANTVYWHSCNTASCNQCSLNSKIATNWCSYGTMFQRITANSADAEPLI